MEKIATSATRNLQNSYNKFYVKQAHRPAHSKLYVVCISSCHERVDYVLLILDCVKKYFMSKNIGQDPDYDSINQNSSDDEKISIALNKFSGSYPTYV
jgi:hypothetical protein